MMAIASRPGRRLAREIAHTGLLACVAPYRSNRCRALIGPRPTTATAAASGRSNGASLDRAAQRGLRTDNPGKRVSLPRVESVGDEMCLLTHEE